MSVNKWYLLPALLIGAGLGWLIFSKTNIDPVSGAAVAFLLAILAGGFAVRNGKFGKY